MSDIALDHAPVLTRHGWVARRYWPAPTTTGPAPETCPAASTHKVWTYGWQRGRTLHLEPHVCDHDTRATRRATAAQGVLW